MGILTNLAKTALTAVTPYWVYIAAGAVAVSAIVGGYVYIKHTGYAQCQADTKAANDAALVAANQKAQADYNALEQTLATERQKNQQLNESLQNEIAQHSVYHTCRVPADGVLLLNRALAGPAAR